MHPLDVAIDSKTPGHAHLLLGTVSAQIDPLSWNDFENFRASQPELRDPLDHWGRLRTMALIADRPIRAHFPDDQPVFPFIRHAIECFPSLSQSPLGMLVSTRFGLMFGIRAWLEGPTKEVTALADRLGWQAAPHGSPCEECTDQPCLSACPVNAFSDTGYDYPGCRSELDRQANVGACWQGGCLARRACPLSTAYTMSQASFHHRAVLSEPS